MLPSPSLRILAFFTKILHENRKKDAMIIYSPVVMKEDEAFDSEEWHKSRATLQVASYFQDLHGLFTENTWNCEISHEVAPKSEDTILTDRNDFSAFAGTNLDLILKMNSIDHFFVM